MKELFRKIQPYSGKIFAIGLVLFFSFLAYNLYNAPVDGFDEKFIYLLKKYGYIILFAWGMLEGMNKEVILQPPPLFDGADIRLAFAL